MPVSIKQLDHVQITVPSSAAEACKNFYGGILGLKQIPRPESQRPGGVWYQLANTQLHVSLEDGMDNETSRRHICYLVDDLKVADEYLRAHGIEILPDERPVPGWPRFYIRDPGGNRIEIANPE